MSCRVKLIPLLGKRRQFRASVCKFSTRPKDPLVKESQLVKTIMLVNVKLMGPSNDVLADHIWLDCENWAKDFQSGDYISFHANVIQYVKGYSGKNEYKMLAKPLSVDYSLNCIGMSRKIKKF